MPVPTHFASIGPDFTTVCAKLLLRSPFSPILAIFAHV
jgi:hypothetical protein